jgi:hypothetical protein
MKKTISDGDSVTLSTFNGLIATPVGVEENENFWKLIGKKGQVLSISPPTSIVTDRVLVRFEANLNEFDLPNHNEVPNSLWIKVSDLTLARN